ncbi:MAG: hypothetical protein ABI598_06090, partial [Chloroflexota bacterium]
PAEAYLSRGARLSTLPDPDRLRGLPAASLDPDVWRGEISVGDQLALVSPSLMERLGPDELKDALVTLHPQPAIEHLTMRFAELGGTGSSGGLILEVGEVSVAKAGRTLVAVRPLEPLAGAPDRSPIPLVDSVSGGLAAAQAGARRARSATGGALRRLLGRAQDSMPTRGPVQRRVTTMGARRESQQRAAVAVLALVVVAGALGVGVSLLGGSQPPGEVIASAEVGQASLDKARKNLERVFGSGVNLVANDPGTAEKLLTDTLAQLKSAAGAGISATVLNPLRAQAVSGLDRLYGVVDVTPTSIFNFPADAAPELTSLVRGPDGAPYVLDVTTASVYRINITDLTAVAIFREGNKAAGSTQAAPRLVTTGGRDLLILDAKNVMWRWRPADATGKGTTTRVTVLGASEWGSDLLAIGTFLRDSGAGLYNLYIVDPSEQEILAYAPAADGSGFPGAPSKRLTAPRPVDGITSLYIDGDIWIADSGRILRVFGGTSDGWSSSALPDGVLRPAPSFSAVLSGSDHRAGRIYGYDAPNERLVAFSKAKGAYIEQYRLTGGSDAWTDVRGWFVEPGIADAPDSVVWIAGTGLFRAVLEPIISQTRPSPEASPSGDSAPSASATQAP